MKYKMLEYDRIDLSEGIVVDGSLWKFYYFLNKGFNYQTYLRDRCHDISIKATSMQNLAIIYHEGYAYRVNFVFMNKNDAFNLTKNSNIIDKKGVL